jgi:hypothetical protein
MERIQKTKVFKLLAVLLVIAMVITSIPVGVYAGQIGGINTGSSTVFSNPSSNPEAKFGGYSVEGVRCYIYDKSSDNILESEVFQGKKAIDFLGYSQEVQDMYNNVEADDIDTTTAFGEITYDEIEFSMDYPFEFDGIQYYYAHYIYDGVNILADKPEDVFNTVVSGTEATNEKLKENNGEELSNIIHKYWGDTIDKEFKRNSNLMFIIEPIFIVSYATGEEKTDTDEFDNGAFYYQSGSVTNDYKVEKYVYFTVDKGGRCSAGEQKIIYSGNNLDTSVQANVQDIDSDTAFTELKEILTEEQYSAVLRDYQEDYIDHFEKAVWYDKYSETTNYYRQYKYAYGTARSIYEQCQNGLEAASNYTIADSVCDAVHCDEIGENGEYNAEYPLIFPANPEAQKPTYGGDENVLEVNGTKTTWGMSILASKEFNESIWHTNKYTTGEPSGVPADDVTNYPNDNGHPYGNNVVEKIYEIRGII